MMDLIDQASGRGKVYSGEDFVAEARYRWALYQEYTDVLSQERGRSRVPTLRPLELTIADTSVPLALDTTFTLHLEDGRKIDFRLMLGGVAQPCSNFY
jgi:hypothetical protein